MARCLRVIFKNVFATLFHILSIRQSLDKSKSWMQMFITASFVIDQGGNKSSAHQLAKR